MKDFNFGSFFILASLLIIETLCNSKCNLNLLSSFKLRGMEYSVHDKMQICPQIDERCCTLMDEVRIVQLWNEYSAKNSKIFANNFMNQVKNFYLLHKFFSQITLKNMIFHYMSFNVIKYHERQCTENTHIRTLRRWSKFIELQRMFPGEGPVKRVGKGKQRYNRLVTLIKRMLEFETPTFERNLELEFGFNSTEPEIQNSGLTRKQRKLMNGLFQNPLEHFMKAQKEFKTASDSFRKEMATSERIISHFPQTQDSKSRNLKLEKKGPSKNKENKKLGKNRLNRSLISLVIFLPNQNSYFNRFKFFTRSRVPYIPINLEIPYVGCSTVRKTLLKPFLGLNEHKYKYCNHAIEKLKSFNIEASLNSLEKMKSNLISIIELKKSLYCSICDARQQRLFDPNRKMVIYSEDFCYDILNLYRDYILFKNVQLIEYLDTIMQIQECSQSSGDENTFPSLNKLSWARRRIPFIQRCYDNLNEPDFYVYCRFICVQYRIQDVSNFFEGEEKLFEEIYGALISFIRAEKNPKKLSINKRQTRVPKEQQGNSTTAVNGTMNLVDQINLDEEEQQLSLHEENHENVTFSEQYVKSEIFEKIKKPTDILNYRTIFSENVYGLNPIKAYSMIDFRVTIHDIFVEQERAYGQEELNYQTLETYIQIKDVYLNNFNNDYKSDFIEFIFDEPKNKKKKKSKAIKSGSGVPSDYNQPVKLVIPPFNQDNVDPAEVDTVNTWFNYFFH